MKTTYTSGRFLGLFLAILFLGLVSPELSAQSVNGTQQLLNRGFEDYDNLGEKSVEPVGWNSFMNAKSAGGIVDAGKEKHLDRAGDRRPGTAGKYSLYVFSTNPIASVTANGNVTTGRINMGSATPTSAENYNFTDRASAGFNFPFTTVPDSMVVWVKYSPGNASDQGQVNAIIHGDNEIKDPGTDKNLAVAIATVNPGKSQEWVRYSVPFDRSGCGSNDPRYILVSITTNKIPGGGSAKIWVDDILFVYNPEIAVNKLPVSSFNLRDGAAVCDIPFTVKGTLPLNSNSAQKNKVVAELSDAGGSFAHPVQIGSVETDESGTLRATIPADMPFGEHYKIRLRGTDRQVLSAPCTEDIVLMRGFSIETTADPGKGTVSGSGAYQEGATVTLKATPLTGYHFSHWEENGQRVEGAGAAYSFPSTADRRLTAVFAVNVYRLTIETEGEGTVQTVSSRYEFEHGERVRLEAAAAAGYTFGGYYANGALLGTNQVHSFNITSDIRITAVFNRNKVLITTSTAQPDWGSVSAGGEYEYGSNVRITATAMPYCYFVAWMEGRDTASRNATYEFTAQENRSLRAVFGQEYHTVSLSPNISGAGVLTGGGRYSAAQNTTTIVLKAEPNTGYEFLYWESKKDGTRYEDSVWVVLDSGRLTEDLAYVAYFALKEYDIALEAVPQGAGVLAGAGRYKFRTRVTLRATPLEHYDFVAWVRVDHGLSDTVRDNPFVFPIEEGRNRSYKALFRLKQHKVSLSTEPASGMGTVSGGGVYSHFDTATLSARAEAGYEFRYWGIRRGLNIDKVSEENPCKIEVLQDVERVAVFSERRKEIQAVCRPQQAGQVGGQGLYVSGNYAVLEAQPAFGYRFVQWEDARGHAGPKGSRLHLMVRNDTTVYAAFAPLRFTFTLMTEGASSLGQVSINGGSLGSRHIQEVYYGDTLRLHAEARAQDYKFTQWRMVYTQDGVLKDSLYSRKSDVEYTVSGESRIVAYFVNNAHYISARVEPDQSGEVLNQGNYRHELWMELVARPAKGYVFSCWKDAAGNRMEETSSRLQVQSLNDYSVQAVFEPESFPVEVEVWGGKNNGSVTGQGVYTHGKAATLTAKPEYGYAFDGWYRADDVMKKNCISKDAEYSFVVEKAERLAAVFAPGTFELDAEIRPRGAGSVSGTGRHTYLSEALLQAKPAGGYALEFILLEKDAGVYDTMREEVAGIRMDKDQHVVVCFEPTPYSLQVFSSDTEQGVAHSEQAHSTFGYGSQVVLKAEAKPDYAFSQWRDAFGKRLSRTAEYTLTIACDTVVYADFVPASKRFSIESKDIRQGYVNAYNNRPSYGSVMRIEATPVSGYEFDAWVSAKDESRVLSRSSVLAVSVSQDTSLLAVFKPVSRTVNLRANIQRAGEVRLNPSDAHVGVWSENYAYAPQGSKMELKAYPSEHYEFTSWVKKNTSRQGISLGTEAVLETEVDGDMDIEAVFTPKNYSVEVKAEPAELGSVQGGGMYGYGNPVTVKAVGGDYVFKGWKTSVGWISDNPEFTFTMGGDTSLTACFSRDTVRVSVRAGIGGSAAGGGDYAKGSPVVLEAEASERYVFEAWYDKDGNELSRQNPYAFTANATGTVVAGFAPLLYTVEAEATQGGSVMGGGSSAYGSPMVLEAVPDSGYRFARWDCETEAIEADYASTPLLGLAVNGNKRVTAVFEPLKYHISTYTSPLGVGTVTAGGDFDYGSSLSFEARPDADHSFKAWTLNGKEVSTEAVLQVDVRGDADYVAVFVPKRYNVVAEAYPAYGGLTYGGGSYYWGDTARVGIYLYDSTVFNDWSNVDFETVSLLPEFLYEVTHTEIFTASVDAPEPKVDDTVVLSPDNFLRVYPNPLHSDGVLHIESSEENILSLRLFSLTGRHILYRRISEEGVQSAGIRLPSLPSGCYFYEIRLSGGSHRRGKLIRR